MADLYYYDQSGSRQGPISGTKQEHIAQLQELVDDGIITQETRLEIRNGRNYLAGTLKEFRDIGLAPEPLSITVNPTAVIAIVLILTFVCAFIPLPLPRPCIMCSGDGKFFSSSCTHCNGTGTVFLPPLTVWKYMNGGLDREL